MARTGKIASLPRDIREQLNERLHDGETGAQILPWLNEVAAEKLASHPRWKSDTTINDNALSNWRRGGYEDWCRNLLKLDVIEKKVELALKINEISGGNIYDSMGQVAAGDLMELLDGSTDPIIGSPDDGAEPAAGPDKIGLALAVAKLLDASAKSRVAGVSEQKLDLDRTRIAQAQSKIDQTLSKLKLEWQKFAGKFVAWYEDQRARLIMEQAGSTRAQKIAALAKVFGEMPDDIGPKL